MQRLIAIVLPEPVAILTASRGRFVSAGSIRIPLRRVVEQVAEGTDALDLGQVDERLDGLALAEVEAEREPVFAAVLVVEPEAEEASRRRAGTRVPVRPPRVDGCADAVHEVRPVARRAALGNLVRIAHLIVTSASFVVSFPKMSITLTTIA
ncbi:MAG: hypothetical protein H0W16_07365 [Actinobacteria bacterium]|nr:hypothetical protein [Actinomycetota bacterium]